MEILYIVLLVIFVVLVAICILRCIFRKKKCIKDRIALVTGGANGLGAAIALKLASYGCHVAIADIDLKNAEEVATQIRTLGVKSQAYEVDVSKYQEIVKLGESIERDLGSVDILVNNAAIIFNGPFQTEDPEKIEKMVHVNVLSVIWTTRVFLEAMIEKKYGHIVTISSIAGITGSGLMVVYATTKFALRGFMESLSGNLSFNGHDKYIKTTTIYPTSVATSEQVCNAYEKGTKIKVGQLSPAKAAETVLDAILYEEEIVTIPRYHYGTYRYTPSLTVRKVLGKMAIKDGTHWNGVIETSK